MTPGVLKGNGQKRTIAGKEIASDTPAADLVEDFSTYTDESDFESDPRGIYVASSDKNLDHVFLDQDVGLDIEGYNLSQSMRYRFDGSYQSRGRSLDLDPNQDEVWIELYLRFSSNFKTDWGNPDKNPDYKLFFAVTDPSRFSFKTGTFGDIYELDTPEVAAVEQAHSSPDEWDGEWHRYRLHFKHESSAGAADGTSEARIANETGGADHYMGSAGTEATDVENAGSMIFLKLGANMNHGNDVTEVLNLWWGRIAVWHGGNDPGWSGF